MFLKQDLVTSDITRRRLQWQAIVAQLIKARGITLHLSRQLAVTLIIYFGQSVLPDVKGEAVHETTSAGGMSYELPHLSVFLQSANHLSRASSLVMFSYRESSNAVKHWALTSVPSLQLIRGSHKSTHKDRLAAHTNNQPCPVASSLSGPFWCPSLRQWRLFSVSDSTHKGLWSHKLSASICWRVPTSPLW